MALTEIRLIMKTFAMLDKLSTNCIGSQVIYFKSSVLLYVVDCMKGPTF